MIRYIKILTIFLLLIIMSGCENKDVTINPYEVDTTLDVIKSGKTTTGAENISAPVETLNTFIHSTTKQYDDIYYYDFNNDNYPEMIKSSTSDIYAYSIYDLSEPIPNLIGDFFIKDLVNGSDCKIYKCYDKKNGETCYVTEETFRYSGYIESYVKKIILYSEGVLYDTVISKRTYHNEDKSISIINDQGQIIITHNDMETAISYFNTKQQILDVFFIGESTTNNDYTYTAYNNLLSIDSNENLYLDSANCIKSCASSYYYLYNKDDYNNLVTIFDNGKISELCIETYSDYVLDDYSFLFDINNLKLLEVKATDYTNLQDVIYHMSNLQYIKLEFENEYDSLDYLKECSSLEIIHLGKGVNSVAEDAYDTLYTLPNLKVVAFSGIYTHITPEQIAHIKLNIPNCLIVFTK